MARRWIVQRTRAATAPSWIRRSCRGNTSACPGKVEAGFPTRTCATQDSSIWIDGKIAQPQFCEFAFLPHAEERPVERLAQRVVAAFDGDADTFAENPTLHVGAADEHAAIV